MAGGAAYGLDGKLLDWGKQERSYRARGYASIEELLQWFHGRHDGRTRHRTQGRSSTPIGSGCRPKRCLPTGQLETFKRTGDLKDVVDQLIAETEEGVLE